MLIGCIGDDFTGSSDLANTLSKQGMKTVQYTGVPTDSSSKDIEAGVIALKSRSIDSAEAVQQSLEALSWLKEQGCEQFFFKYCSTFDSTEEGNIGPVIDALAKELNAYKVIICPAFPGTGRSIYQGHLFVHDALLNESGMQSHPLTPMTDPDIRRWLKKQTQNNVGHIAANIVLSGSEKIKTALQDQHEKGNRLIVVDALTDSDLYEIGAAADKLPLITGGSGVAIGLPANFSRQGKIGKERTPWKGESGKCIALSGSCSKATREQVTIHCKHNPSYEIDASDVIQGKLLAKNIVEWALNSSGIPIIFSSADPIKVKQIQDSFGQERSAFALEEFFAELARQFVEAGITKILTAGGETSGAVVEGLKLNTLEIGPEIDPGVPALRAGESLVVALKSGNFGAPDYFEKAAAILGGKI
ncbi:HPr kinase [Marinomonas ushuaiensis DSM 15871]|uniref:3-oxo-tetronate kinase n=1 Tax=Marinomonas ushuaiensis DSM 15871 TaxID=1122207 RepID=X7E0S3_9GAMM|nr:3-oxo-tetronate kinase [Marinomonas ushuaiensis]ETX09684.1 HPr kinase [Marinomonas ushuaiensis DSM 15871]